MCKADAGLYYITGAWSWFMPTPISYLIRDTTIRTSSVNFMDFVGVILCGRFHAMLHYIAGGIPEDVDEKVLHAAFIPFGDIMDIQIPLDYETGLHSS